MHLVWKRIGRLFTALLITVFALSSIPNQVDSSLPSQLDAAPFARALLINVVVVLIIAIFWNMVILVAHPRQNSLGRRAAWRLLEQGDERGIENVLSRWLAWEVEDETDEENERIEAALSQRAGGCSPTLQSVLRATLAPYFSNRRERRDFSDSAADVLLALLRCLSRAGGPENVKAMRRVADFPVPADAPNRQMIQEVTRAFLGEGKPVIPALQPMETAVAVASAEASATLRVGQGG